MLTTCLNGAAPAPAPAPAPATPPVTGPTVPSSVAGLYYPDWEGANTGCLNDGNQPAYITSNPSLYMYSTLSECCKARYSWTLSTCDPSGSSGPTGSSGSALWCMSWSLGKCAQTCEFWDYTYATQSQCCSQRMWWDTAGCMA